jgi:hypothetical protein
MSTRTIVHNFKYIFPLFLLLILLFVKTTSVSVRTASATEVLRITIDPPFPAYNQPFKCTLTLDRDDHRNACDLMPLNAPMGMFPWDICRIDHISSDAHTRFYNCVANKDRNVPGPGNYQIVVWNFTGDGETGQVTARQNITILDQLPPTPTNIPKPTFPPYVPPEPTITPPLQLPPQNNLLPSQKVAPTVVVFSIPPQKINDQINNNASINISQNIKLPTEMVNQWKQQLSNGFTQTVEKTQRSVLKPLVELVLNFMKEANY